MDHILFAGPWIKTPGYLPLRVVLHAHCTKGKPTEYIVHYQVKQENGKLSYDTGHYFPVHSYGDGEALSKAMERFWEKCKQKYHNSITPFIMGLDEPDEEFLATLASDPNLP